MSRMGWDRPEEQEQEESIGLRARLAFLRILFGLVLLFLLFRVWSIQQTRGVDLKKSAEDNQFATLTDSAPRGVIFDRNGQPLALNQPSFNVTITPAFLPSNENELQAVYERLSLLTGVPVTNTVQQQALISIANPELVSTYTRLAQIYGAPIDETLDQAGIVPRLPESIAGIVEENSFAQYIPAVITSGISITLAHRIEQESIFLPGVRVLEEPLRDYPSGEYTSHLIGYMGSLPNRKWLEIPGYELDDRVGWAGLETSMEFELAGAKGQRTIEVDWTGREVRQIGLTDPPTAGLNLHLTLDLRLQKIAHEILSQYMEENRNTARVDEITGERTFPEIEQAAVVALNPQTGEVLAMVSLPTFDNNRFQTEVPVDYYLRLARDDYAPLVNHAISGTYPPGSTFKLVPAAAALSTGIISADRRLNAPGSIEIRNRFAPNDPGKAQLFVCWVYPNGEHGAMDMRLGLANSCDIYFYKISGGFGFDQEGEFVEGVGIDRLGPFANQFGFGVVQGIELPLEAAGNIPSRAWKRQTQGEPWSTGDDYNFGIGQGFVTATPMQVAQMAAVVANGGFLLRPKIIHHITDDEEGRIVIVDESNSQIIARAQQESDGTVLITDVDGNAIDNPPFIIEFDENGGFIFQQEVLGAVDASGEDLRVIAEGMQLVNQRIDEEKFFTGATYIDWLDGFGITSAGKTGTAEYCDNIAIDRGWCRFEDIIKRRVLPTHSWYVGYAPYEEPEIVVSTFVFNGGEGSQWSATVSCHVMAAYFGLGQYAEGLTESEWAQTQLVGNRACEPSSPLFRFYPTYVPETFAPEEVDETESGG